MCCFSKRNFGLQNANAAFHLERVIGLRIYVATGLLKLKQKAETFGTSSKFSEPMEEMVSGLIIETFYKYDWP